MMVESLCWITIHNDMRKAKFNTLLFLLSSSQTFSFFLLDRPACRWLLAPQASHFSYNQIHVSCPTKIQPQHGKSHNLSKHINLSLHKHISLEMYYLNNSVIPPTSHNFDEQNSVMSVKAINSKFFFPLFKDQQLV